MGKALVCALLSFIDFVDYLLESVAVPPDKIMLVRGISGGNLSHFVFNGQIFTCELSKLILEIVDSDFGAIGFKV